MTISEFKQTLETLRNICENLQEEMQFSLVFPDSIKELEVQKFDKIGSKLLDILNEF